MQFTFLLSYDHAYKKVKPIIKVYRKTRSVVVRPRQSENIVACKNAYASCGRCSTMSTGIRRKQVGLRVEVAARKRRKRSNRRRKLGDARRWVSIRKEGGKKCRSQRARDEEVMQQQKQSSICFYSYTTHLDDREMILPRSRRWGPPETTGESRPRCRLTSTRLYYLWRRFPLSLSLSFSSSLTLAS